MLIAQKRDLSCDVALNRCPLLHVFVLIQGQPTDHAAKAAALPDFALDRERNISACGRRIGHSVSLEANVQPNGELPH